MGKAQNDSLLQAETTCGTLLYELQIIWDEVGESETDRDKMLLDLERECLEVYRRKVDQANRCRAQLRQAIADAEAELASICSAMGERPVHIRQQQSDQKIGSLREELNTIRPQLEEMRKRKIERRNQFLDILDQIHKVSNEIHGGSSVHITSKDETDLSTRRLEELQAQLQTLQKEKSDRLKQVMQHLNDLNSLCLVLGFDFKQTLHDIHPSLAGSEDSYGLSNDIIQCLVSAIKRLRQLKVQRMQKLQDLATTMLELWNLMDTPVEEQQAFQNVTRNIAASEEEVTQPDMLSSDFIKHVEEEVSRLEALKSSKMKELVLKKRAELEEICRKTHMLPQKHVETEYLIQVIESGALDSTAVLEQIELEIAKVKEEAFSRKDILDRVDKWKSACEEESWLEEYNMDENRYNAGRGAHLILKRAEKARAFVNKLPGMVESLAAKARAWENERGMEFMYDGIRLLSLLEEDSLLRQEKEQEKKRQREQKKLQGQLIAEQEALFGSKPSPMKMQSGKKASRMSTGGNNRRLSMGGAMIQTPRPESAHSARVTPHTRTAKKADRHDHIHHHAEDDFGTNVRRGLDIANIPMKANSLNGCESESPMVRRPFSPISTTTSSRVNNTSSFEDLNRTNNDIVQKVLPKTEMSQETVTSTSFATPLKTHPPVDEENRTPKGMTVAIPIPSTPSTVSAPMQTAMTPAPPLYPYGTNSGKEGPEEIEYSFEERRAGFVLPDLHVKRAIQV